MAKSRRRARTEAPKAPAEPKQPGRHHAAIWLATLSTVVGIATGMFTLRDQVFPRESGSAQAVSVSAYQQQVGGVCDDVNTDDSRRARQVKTIHKQLVRAKTTTAQRNALLDGQKQTIARSGDALASFAALEPPKHLRATDRAVKAAWNRNLTRLRNYAERLDSAGTRPELVASVRFLATLRTPLARDGVELMAGLRRLGGANCDLRTPINTKTFPLPPLKQKKKEHASHSAESGSGAASGQSASSGQTGSASTGSGGTTGGTTPPSGGSTGSGGTTGGGAVPHSGTGTAGGTGGTTGTPGTTGGGGGGGAWGGGGTGTGGSTGGSGGGNEP